MTPSLTERTVEFWGSYSRSRKFISFFSPSHFRRLISHFKVVPAHIKSLNFSQFLSVLNYYRLFYNCASNPQIFSSVWETHVRGKLATFGHYFVALRSAGIHVTSRACASLRTQQELQWEPISLKRIVKQVNLSAACWPTTPFHVDDDAMVTAAAAVTQNSPVISMVKWQWPYPWCVKTARSIIIIIVNFYQNFQSGGLLIHSLKHSTNKNINLALNVN